MIRLVGRVGDSFRRRALVNLVRRGHRRSTPAPQSGTWEPRVLAIDPPGIDNAKPVSQDTRLISTRYPSASRAA